MFLVISMFLLSVGLHAQVQDFDQKIDVNQICKNNQKPPERVFAMKRDNQFQTPSHKHYMLCAEPEFKVTEDLYENFRVLAFGAMCDQYFDKLHCADGAVNSKPGRVYKFREPKSSYMRLFVDEFQSASELRPTFSFTVRGGPKDFDDVEKSCAVRKSDKKYFRSLSKSKDENELSLHKELTEKRCI